MCPITAFTVRIEVQGTPLEAVVDTGAEIRRPVTMMQAGDGAHLEGFLAGPFDVKVGQSTHQIDLYVAHLKDSMLLGMDFLRYRAKLDWMVRLHAWLWVEARFPGTIN